LIVVPLESVPFSSEALAVSPGVALGIGAALIVAGRRLFWLFVGAVGFFAFSRLAREYLGSEHPDWVLIGSAIAGIAGAIFAIFLQKVAVGLAGAAMGVYALDQVFRHSMETYPSVGLLLLAVAAIVGALVTVAVFEWALIFLTSLLGAHLLAQLVDVQRGWLILYYVALVAIGVGIQSRQKKGDA
jgi:hypothetical protein